MRARSKTNKVLDIALSEEKFYFPGETIRGRKRAKDMEIDKKENIHLFST